jgi:hypothetical protein
MIIRLTDPILSIKSENVRPVTRCRIEDVLQRRAGNRRQSDHFGKGPSAGGRVDVRKIGGERLETIPVPPAAP